MNNSFGDIVDCTRGVAIMIQDINNKCPHDCNLQDPIPINTNVGSAVKISTYETFEK